jgi:hypothetical protein
MNTDQNTDEGTAKGRVLGDGVQHVARQHAPRVGSGTRPSGRRYQPTNFEGRGTTSAIEAFALHSAWLTLLAEHGIGGARSSCGIARPGLCHLAVCGR